MPERIALVGCVKTKLDVPAPAKDLYISPLFRGRRAHVERTCGRWFVLSALHGMLGPDEVIAPYDHTLQRVSARGRRAWTGEVLAQLDQRLETIVGRVIEIHAGAAYAGHGLIEGLEARGATVDWPVAGLALGEQLAFYGQARPVVETPRRSQSTPAPAPVPVPPGDTTPVPVPTGKYRPLYEALQNTAASDVALSFAEIESILGTSLPESAHRYQAWWSNDESGTHSHARAWLAAGFLTGGVNLQARQVVFRRRR